MHSCRYISKKDSLVLKCFLKKTLAKNTVKKNVSSFLQQKQKEKNRNRFLGGILYELYVLDTIYFISIFFF